VAEIFGFLRKRLSVGLKWKGVLLKVLRVARIGEDRGRELSGEQR
jgi:hypothetical protein